MTLEHYPGMTERELARVEAEAAQRWPLQASLIVHRVGTLKPGDNIVLVVTASAHGGGLRRRRVPDGLPQDPRALLEEGDGADGTERWVEARDSDDRAAERWSGDGP